MDADLAVDGDPVTDWRHDGPVWTDRETWEVGETEHFLVDLCPMIYNHRLVLTPKDMPLTYLVGWCYKSKAAALLAVQLWEDPETSEPIGAIKRVGYWPL